MWCFSGDLILFFEILFIFVAIICSYSQNYFSNFSIFISYFSLTSISHFSFNSIAYYYFIIITCSYIYVQPDPINRFLHFVWPTGQVMWFASKSKRNQKFIIKMRIKLYKNYNKKPKTLDGLGMFPNDHCECKMSISCTRNNMVEVAR